MDPSRINLEKIFGWRDSKSLLAKLQEFGLIHKDGEIKCPVNHCNGFFGSVHDGVKGDGLRWRCRGCIVKVKAKRVKCVKTASIRYNSFFFHSNLPLWKIMAFCHLWARKCRLSFIAYELSMGSHSSVYWASNCREVVFDAFIENNGKIGGPGKIVEIDESQFGKRKCNRGHIAGSWVFGGIERGSGKIFMVVVKDRTVQTLLECIEKHIEQGTTIYSDCWSGYEGLKDHPNYHNLQVNHSIIFKASVTKAHTNSIEGSWRHAKASAKYSNRKKCFMGGYLARYMFLKKVKELKQDPTLFFFTLVRDLYGPTPTFLTNNGDTEKSESEDEQQSDFDFD